MTKTRCPNMNHGKSNARVKYCPNCGELFNSSLIGQCDEAKHQHLRKNRNLFCTDCGKKLTK